METTGGDASWPNGNNDINNTSIHNMVGVYITYINQHANKWCCTTDKLAEIHRCKLCIVLEITSTHSAWYDK